VVVSEVSGFSFVGQGESVGLGFVKLRDWGEILHFLKA